jgi:hypothetical protein
LGEGVRSSDLGIDPTYANKIRNRKVRISDKLLEKLIKMLTVDEFATLITSKQPQQLVVREPQSLSEAALVVDQHVRGLELVLDKYPQLSNVVYQRLVELLRSRIRGYSLTVTKEHIETFERFLRSKAPKTRSERLRYLRGL